MSAADYDVFLCFPDRSAGPLARTVAAALAQRGFRVFQEERTTSEAADPRRLALIAEVPDFLVVEETAEQGFSPASQLEIERALATGRNVVRVAPGAAVNPAALPALARSEVVRYDAARAGQSIALLAHHLSSDGTVEDRRLMRRAKRLFWGAVLVLLAGIALQEVPALLERWSRVRLLDPVQPFSVQWAAVGQRLDAGRWVSFPVKEGAVLRDGDRLQVVFSTSADGYAYVVSRDTGGRVSVWFPSDVMRGASRVKAGELHAAPVDGGWLTVEEGAAPETIFIIAGYDAQQNLEELTEEPESATTPAARRTLLESAVSGLLDGRHGAAERRVWTGKLHPIDPALAPPAGLTRASVQLAGGADAPLTLARQPGLVSACVEVRLSPR